MRGLSNATSLDDDDQYYKDEDEEEEGGGEAAKESSPLYPIPEHNGTKEEEVAEVTGVEKLGDKSKIKIKGKWMSVAEYLKDDTLYFRISVKVSDHKPWLECTV